MSNAYQDIQRAEAYAKMEFPATYYLAYRDLPEIILQHVTGRRAIDFGCGAGRSTRFLRKLGFETIGIDVSPEMILKAKEIDPDGDYRLIHPADFSGLEQNSYDLVLCAFPFDNIPTMQDKVKIFTGLGNLLTTNGKIVNLVSSPEIYVNEWSSFSTRDFSENSNAKSGDRVRIVVTAMEDARPIEDTLWSDEDYHAVYSQSGLRSIATHRPLAKEDEPYRWVNETKISPWVIYVIRKDASS